MESISQIFSPIPISSSPHSEGHQKRKRGQFESDCESIGDNFEFYLKRRTNQYVESEQVIAEIRAGTSTFNFKEKMCYIWTNERLKLIALAIIARELLTLTNNEAHDSPTENDITEKLNDIASCYRHKDSSYYDLKKILGQNICKKFRVLVRHERFDEYVPIGATSRRVSVSQAVEFSMSPGSDHFYWIDIRLQVLVSRYYMYLEDLKSDSSEQGTSKNNSEKCLANLERNLGGKVPIPKLRSKLDNVFKDYEEKSSTHQEFRIRIGKDMCTLFDSLVNLDRDLYKKKDTTSSRSRGTSSRLKSSSMSINRMSLIDQRNAEADRVNMELLTLELELNEEQVALAMLSLSDNDKRSFFFGHVKVQ